MREVNQAGGFGFPQSPSIPSSVDHPLNTSFFESVTPAGGSPEATPEGPFHRWLTVEQIRKMQRMRRETVLAAMFSGELPYEKRGRIRYARVADVIAWEERRLRGEPRPSRRPVAPELADLAG